MLCIHIDECLPSNSMFNNSRPTKCLVKFSAFSLIKHSQQLNISLRWNRGKRYRTPFKLCGLLNFPRFARCRNEIKTCVMSAKKKICNFSWKSLLKCKFSFAVSLNLLSLSILMRGMRLENVMCKRARSRVQLFTNSAVIVGCETRRRKLLLKPKISPGKAVSCGDAWCCCKVQWHVT